MTEKLSSHSLANKLRIRSDAAARDGAKYQDLLKYIDDNWDMRNREIVIQASSSFYKDVSQFQQWLKDGFTIQFCPAKRVEWPSGAIGTVPGEVDSFVIKLKE